MVSCEQVWANISAYLDNDLSSELRPSVEEHIRGCSKCAAVVNGVRNIVTLYGDDRFIPLPEGYSLRLRQRIRASTRKPATSRWTWGWAAAVAAVALLVGALTLGKSTFLNSPELRSQLAQPGIHVPPELQVVVEPQGKLFHVVSCGVIRDRQHLRTMTSAEAVREGYTPCPRCMKDYLKLADIQVPVFGVPTAADYAFLAAPE
jgi:hypothetical protein